MFITINDIIGEKTIDLSYAIQNFDPSKEVAVMSMFSDKVEYEMKEPLGLKLMNGSEKQVLKKTYTCRELDVVVERELLLTDLDRHSRIIKKDKSAKITDMIFILDELDNSDNLEDGRPGNTLFTYYVFGFGYFMSFEPKTNKYKKLENGEILSLTLRITDQNGNIITNGPGTTVVFHIQ